MPPALAPRPLAPDEILRWRRREHAQEKLRLMIELELETPTLEHQLLEDMLLWQNREDELATRRENGCGIKRCATKGALHEKRRRGIKTG